MRRIQSFVLRLLIDSAKPQVLRGALQPMPDGQAYPFVGERQLLRLLRRLMARPADAPPSAVTAGEGEVEAGTAAMGHE